MGHYVHTNLFPIRFQIRQMISLDEHESCPPDPSSGRPLIVHSPTAPVAKGTQFILEAIASLRTTHEFDFVLVQNMSRGAALDVMKRCDIFIDQLVLGAYGYASVEAMAFGKPVICYINPITGTNYPAELPIMNADPNNIREKLAELIDDGNRRNELGHRGRAYVEKHHDGAKVALDLIDIYKTVTKLHADRVKGRNELKCLSD
jgi:glycosyltransferase involved in cell wall biosynthesis